MASNENNIMQPQSSWEDLGGSGLSERSGHKQILLPYLEESSSDPADIDVEMNHPEQQGGISVGNTGISNVNYHNGLTNTEHNGFIVGSNGSESSITQNIDNSHQRSQGPYAHYEHTPNRAHVTVQDTHAQRQDTGNAPGVIQTITDEYYQSPRRPWHRPLTQRYMKILLVVATIAAFVFFPTGIPAVFLALKTRREFDKGIMIGDIEKAQKCANRSQNLTVFSFLLCILFVVLAGSIYARVVSAHHTYAVEMASNGDSIMQPTSPWVDFSSTDQTRHNHALFPGPGESSSDPAQIDVTISGNDPPDNTRIRNTSFNMQNNTNGHTGTSQNGFQVDSAGPTSVNEENTSTTRQQTHVVHYEHKPDRVHVTIQEPEPQNRDSGREPAVIQTMTNQYYQSPRRRNWQRPLTQSYMKILFIMSIIGAFLFFPTGIPAVFYAVRTREEFDKGIMLGDIEKAQKYAKRSQHLTIFSFLLCILIIVLAVSIHTRVNNDDKDDSMYPATHL